MKLENLRQKLLVSNKSTPKKIVEKKIYENQIKTVSLLKSTKENIMSYEEEKKLKIIGITGSKGKTTVANILHQYLKKRGYKSVLYASNGIDSPASFNIPNEAIENPLPNEQILLNAIEEAIAYDADFLILEVNERSIHKGLTKDIPFDIRVITNIGRTHNNIFYPDYVEIKKNFFRETKIEDDVTCIFSANDAQMFNELYNVTNSNKVTYMSDYVARIKNIDTKKIDYKLSTDGILDSLNGLDFNIMTRGKKYNFKSSMLMPYNAINIMAVMAIVDTLNIFDYEVFKDLLLDIEIPGRDEVIKSNGRTIIITTGIDPQLTILKKYKQTNEVNKLIVVSGAPGFGYKNWTYDFSEEKIIHEREKGIEFAYTYIKNNADKLYITENDNGTVNLEKLMNFQASYLKNEIPYVIENNRTEAIKKAIIDSNEGDVIYIAGRGNRKILVTSFEDLKIHSDKEVVLQLLQNLGWLI